MVYDCWLHNAIESVTVSKTASVGLRTAGRSSTATEYSATEYSAKDIFMDVTLKSEDYCSTIYFIMAL